MLADGAVAALQVPGLSRAEECTARTYAAEALLGLGDASGAAEHLMHALQQVPPGADGDGQELQAALLTNLAVACATLEDYEQVGQHLTVRRCCTPRCVQGHGTGLMRDDAGAQAAALATRAGQLPGCACREEAELIMSFASLRMRDGHAAAG